VRREEVGRLRGEYGTSERHACELLEAPRSSCRYRSRREDGGLRERLRELAREQPRFGYRRLHVLLRREGVEVNHKRVQRVYRELGLTVKRLRRKRLARALRPHPVLTRPNQEWALDFASDMAASGQRLRILSVVDSYTRECLALEIDTSLPSQRVTRELERIAALRGLPETVRCDNGPEITSRHFLAWCLEQKVDVMHIRPGKPTENAHVESFHGRLRDECLNTSWFWNLFDARRKVAAWKNEYNRRRPHSSLGYRTPEEFAQEWKAAAVGSAAVGAAPPAAARSAL
jgi:putative transposase